MKQIRSILIVDDSEDLRLLCARALRGEGLHTITAATAEEALRHLHASPFDLLVIDFLLPPPTLQLRVRPRHTRAMNGVGLMHEALARRPQLPILFISVHPPETLRAQGVPRSVPILQKPFRGEVFYDAVMHALARVAAERASPAEAAPAQPTRLAPRQHRRFIVHGHVTFEGLSTGTGQLLDLSETGGKIRSGVTVSVGTHLTLRIEVPSTAAMKVNVAVVRWVHDDTFGVEFVWIDPEVFRGLQHYLSRYEA